MKTACSQWGIEFAFSLTTLPYSSTFSAANTFIEMHEAGRRQKEYTRNDAHKKKNSNERNFSLLYLASIWNICEWMAPNVMQSWDEDVVLHFISKIHFTDSSVGSYIVFLPFSFRFFGIALSKSARNGFLFLLTNKKHRSC